MKTTLLSVLFAVLTASLAHGQLVINGSFEDSASQPTGWSSTGDINIWTAANGITPTDGVRQLEMSTSETAGAAAASVIESFLNLSSGTLFANGGGGAAAEGSAIKQSITVGAADVGKFLTFNWNLITANHFSTTERDYAFLSINGNSTFIKLADIQSPLIHDGQNAVFDRETGYQTFNSYQFTSPGTYTLGFGVIDINGIESDIANSGLVLDNIALSVVPEPAQWSAIAAAALALFAIGRRWRGQVS